MPNVPPGVSELYVSVVVARDVSCDLVRPVADVGARSAVVHGTAVPETAVDEDRELNAGKTMSALRRSSGNGRMHTRKR